MAFFKRCLVVLIFQIGCLAFDHSAGDLAFQEDDLRVMVNHYPSESVIPSGTERNDDNELVSESLILSFHPKLYDFKESPVGMPRLGLVRVENRLKDENLKLISISGNTVNFHSSFFADKVIGPGNHTTFEVVFLSREEGHFESTLYIHTSRGLFKYHVRGTGLPNPYRLRPLVGAKIPVNASYEPLIMLHNPHDTQILVVEMLSSGTDFSLKLPDDADEHLGDTAWAIDPFQTKPVMQGSFQGRTEGNHTGFIRIKVNHTAASGEYLMVPVEVQVSSSPGIYSPQESLDFGLLVQSDKPRTLKLSLINAQTNPVNVQSVSVKGEPNPALRIEFRPLVIEPEIMTSTVVALVTFDPSELSNMDQSSGFIEIRSDCGKSISIPYQATVIKGELEYNISSLGFYIKSDNVPPRNFSVRNNFSTAVAIYQVSVNHPDIVQIDQINQSHVIIPGEQKTIFTLKIHNKDDLCGSKEEIQLTLKSNVTSLKLPIICYNGKLEMHSFEEAEVDFGRVELYSTHTEYFSVENRNPVEIRLKSWGSNSSWSIVELVGMQKGVKEDLSKIQDFDGLKKSLFLQPGHVAVFSIEVRRPTVEGTFYGESYVTTDHNQTLRVPFRFIASKGSVQSENILFDKVFPGKISYEKLYLSSTFNHTLNLLRIRANPPSSVWFSSSSLQEYPEVSPHRRNFVGKVHFDPRKFCGQDCYSGFCLDTELGKLWSKGASINWETGNIDMRILKTLQARYHNIKDATVSNISVWIDTSGLTGFKAKAQVRYLWPRISTSRVVIFPLTALGNHSVMEILLHNPSELPILIQAVLAKDYGPAWFQFTYANNVGGNTTEGELVFNMDGVFTSSSSQPNGSVILDQSEQQVVHDLLGLNNSYSSLGLTFLLPAGAKFLLSVAFKPLTKDMASTLLLLRNNLTGIETVWLKGRAGTGQLTVGNGTPGSSLLFQLTEKILQGCQTEQASKYVPPQLTVRRSFVARNVGEIPLNIEVLQIYPPQGSVWTIAFGSFSSPADPCEGYGFRILNCHPFKLQPNQTHSIDIAFTPDFTLSRVVRSLQLTDSTGSNFNYSLVALVPSGMLGVCASIISRPSWEPIFKYTLGFGAIMCVIAAVVMSYFEAGTVVSGTVVATMRVCKDEEPDGSKDEDKGVRLDFKAVYDKVENRFKRHQLESHKTSASNSTSHLQSTSCKSQLQNGSSANNGNIRNRKAKKTGHEISPLSNMAKQVTDKVNSSRNSLQNMSLLDFMDDGNTSSSGNSANSNTVGLGKKDKENTTVASLQSTIGKKKKATSGSQQSTYVLQPSTQVPVKNKKSQGKVESLSSFTEKVTKGKIEEETSSTTTEGSNSEDFIPPFLEKERKHSLKSSNDSKAPKSLKKEKQEKSKQASGSTENISDSTEQLVSKYTSDEFMKRQPATKKKETNKIPYSTLNSSPSRTVSPKQDMWDAPRPPSGDGLSELAAQTEAFVMQKPPKRNNSGGDPTSNYHNSNMLNIGPLGSSNPNLYAPQAIHQLAPSFLTQQQTAQSMSSNRSKKPGVIGQPRPAQQQPSTSMQQQITTGSNSFVQVPMNTVSFNANNGLRNNFASVSDIINMSSQASVSSVSNANKRQTSPTTTSSGRPCGNSTSNSIWGPDILPNNGCDIWGRRTADTGSNLLPGYFNQQVGTKQSSESNYARGTSAPFRGSSANNFQQIQNNGFGAATSLSSGMHSLPSDNQFSDSRMPPRSTITGSVGLSGNTYSSGNNLNLSRNGSDSTYLYGGESYDILSSLWHMNGGPSHPDQQQFRGPGFTNGQTTQFGVTQPNSTSQQTTSQQQHAYLQRMGSDPANMLRTQRPKNWNPSSRFGEQDSGLNGNTNIQDPGSNNTEGTPLWHSPTAANAESSVRAVAGPSRIDSSFTEWSKVGAEANRLAEVDAGIWDCGSTSTASNWPSSYGSATSMQNTYIDSMAVGSGSRNSIQARQQEEPVTSTSGDGGIRARTSDLREVEVGLGFNPFKSDIWGQSDGPSWGSSFRQYSSNNE